MAVHGGLSMLCSVVSTQNHTKLADSDMLCMELPLCTVCEYSPLGM